MSDSEEEYLVYLEFDSLIDTEIFKKEQCVFKLIGAETDVPVLQIGHQVFAGQYRDIPGTALFFEEDPAPPVADPVFTIIPEKNLQFVHKTRKALHMSRVFVKSKCDDTMHDTEPTSETHYKSREQEVTDTVMFEEPVNMTKEVNVSMEREVDTQSTPGPSGSKDTCQSAEGKNTSC